MAHGKKAYGEDSFQKTGVRGFCKPLRISRIKKDGRVRKAELPSFFMFVHVFYISAILYLSCHGGRVSKFCRSHFSEERQGG